MHVCVLVLCCEMMARCVLTRSLGTGHQYLSLVYVCVCVFVLTALDEMNVVYGPELTKSDHSTAAIWPENENPEKSPAVAAFLQMN